MMIKYKKKVFKYFKNKVIINKPINNNDFSAIFMSTPSSISEKYYDEYIYTILHSINLLNNGDDLLIYIYYSPWIDNMLGLYMILIDAFETVDIIFPKKLFITKNCAYFILKNKLKNVSLPKKKFKINLKSKNISELKDKFNKYAVDLLAFIDFIYNLDITLINLTIEKDFLYKILTIKISNKLLE